VDQGFDHDLLPIRTWTAAGAEDSPPHGIVGLLNQRLAEGSNLDLPGVPDMRFDAHRRASVASGFITFPQRIC